MSEQLEFKTVEQLQQLSPAELNALWELVPTERQRAYKAAYEREVRAAGAVGSDALERQVAGELLKRYRESALVPRARWCRLGCAGRARPVVCRRRREWMRCSMRRKIARVRQSASHQRN